MGQYRPLRGGSVWCVLGGSVSALFTDYLDWIRISRIWRPPGILLILFNLRYPDSFFHPGSGLDHILGYFRWLNQDYLDWIRISRMLRPPGILLILFNLRYPDSFFHPGPRLGHVFGCFRWLNQDYLDWIRISRMLRPPGALLHEHFLFGIKASFVLKIS